MNLRKYNTTELREWAGASFKTLAWIACLWLASAIAWNGILDRPQPNFTNSSSLSNFFFLEGADPFGVCIAVIGGIVLTLSAYWVTQLVLALGYVLAGLMRAAYRTLKSFYSKMKTDHQLSDCQVGDCECGYHWFEGFDSVTKTWSHVCRQPHCKCVRHPNRGEVFDENAERWTPRDPSVDPVSFLTTH